MTAATFFTLLVLAIGWVLYALSAGDTNRGKTNRILENTIIFGIFVTAFIPIIVTPSLFFPFITGKNFLFRLVVEIIGAAWVVLALRDADYRPKKSIVFWGFVALVSTMLISTVFAADPFRAFWSNFERMEGYVTLLHLAVFFIVTASVIGRRAIWERLLQTTLGASLIVCFYGVFQMLGFAAINEGGVRVDSFFGNATYLAIYTVFAAFFAAILALRSRDKKISSQGMWWTIGSAIFVVLIFLLTLTQATIADKGTAIIVGILLGLLASGAAILAKKFSAAWIYAAVGLLNLVILYYTATRGSVLGLIGALMLMAVIILLSKHGSKALRRTSGVFLIAVIVLGGGFLAIKNTSFVTNNPVLSRFGSISLSDSETVARFYVWDEAWKGFTQDPKTVILGWGQDNFNLVFNQYYDPRMYSQEQWFDRTHDVVLDWLIAGGILGLAGYLFLFGSALWMIWKKGDMSFGERTLLTGLLTAYFIHNIFVFDNITSLILYVTVLAYIQARGAVQFAKLSGEGVSDKRTNTIALPVTIIIALGLIYFLNYPGYATGRAVINALSDLGANNVTAAVTDFQTAASYDALGRTEVNEQIVENLPSVLNSNLSNTDKETYAQFAQTQVEKELSETPGDAREELFAGNFYTIVGETSQAEAAYKEAVTLSPDKQTILFALGTLYIDEKQYDEALAVFKQAYELDTTDSEALEYYIAAAAYDSMPNLVAQLSASTTPDVYLADPVVAAYVAESDWPEVIKLLQERIQLLPANVQDHLSLVAAYVKAGENQAAIAEIRTVIAQYPSYAQVGEQAIESIQSGKGLGQ